MTWRRVSALVLFGAAIGSGGCATMSRAERAYAACAVADLAITAYGLEQGYAEGNPVLGDYPVATSAAISIGLAAPLHFDKSGKPIVDLTWKSIAGARCAAAAWNLSVVAD